MDGSTRRLYTELLDWTKETPGQLNDPLRCTSPCACVGDLVHRPHLIFSSTGKVAWDPTADSHENGGESFGDCPTKRRSVTTVGRFRTEQEALQFSSPFELKTIEGLVIRRYLVLL